MNQAKQRVAVVGAGISGLAAAHRLGALDDTLEITVFEGSGKPGGVLQTEHTDDGFCIELGPDSILSRLPWGVDLCRQIGLEDELIRTSESQRGAFVVFRGGLHRIPEGLAVMAPQRIWPFVTTPILSWRGKLRLAAERLIPRRRSPDDESLANFTRRRLGREMFERLVQPLASGIYMGDPEQLSIQAAFPQFVEMESKYGSLIRASRAGRAKGATKAETGGPQYSLFVAPRRGLAAVIDALVSQLSRCRILCNQRVKSLARHEQGWSVHVEDDGTGAARHEVFAGVIVAVPAYHASSLLDAVDQDLAGLLADIPYAGCVVVNLAYPRAAIPHPLDSFGFLVPHAERRPVVACTFSSVKYAERAPQGKVLLRAFLGGACHPEVLEWPDERVVQTVRDELRQLLGVRESPLFSRIKRWRRAMPQYHLGHLQRVERIEQLADKLPGLGLAGNAYRGVGIPYCIRDGQQASERLSAALKEKNRHEPTTR